MVLQAEKSRKFSFLGATLDMRKGPDIQNEVHFYFLMRFYDQYRYSVFVTNLDLPAQQVWNLYLDRADAENRIKELKYDFGADNFCLSHFFATEAAFRFIMVAYNLISLFR